MNKRLHVPEGGCHRRQAAAVRSCLKVRQCGHAPLSVMLRAKSAFRPFGAARPVYPPMTGAGDRRHSRGSSGPTASSLKRTSFCLFPSVVSSPVQVAADLLAPMIRGSKMWEWFSRMTSVGWRLSCSA